MSCDKKNSPPQLPADRKVDYFFVCLYTTGNSKRHNYALRLIERIIVFCIP